MGIGAPGDEQHRDLAEGRVALDRAAQLVAGDPGHHHVEDYSYFPIFRAAEKRLAKGFDVLEGDHQAMHAEILRTVESANGLLRAMERDDDARRAATDAYTDASEQLLKFLVRHLDDEEDLIMPVILDQGERKLFGMPGYGVDEEEAEKV